MMDSEQIKRERTAFETWWCEDIGVPEHHRKRFTCPALVLCAFYSCVTAFCRFFLVYV